MILTRLLIIFSFFLILTTSQHTNNWAVLVGTSRFWFNYRHVSNVLGVYDILKENGFRDDHIILMLADDVACDPRNVHPAQIFKQSTHSKNLYRDDTQVDYRGYEVTVENFLRVLLGRHDPSVPKNKRMQSDQNSNILVYLTGHGGDEFLKFQDIEEITAEDIKQTVQQMKLKNRFREMLMIVDTCQAATLFQTIDSKGVVTAASSSLGESSYSHSNDPDLGVSVIDRFTYYTLEFFRKHKKKIFNINPTESSTSIVTLQDLFSTYSSSQLNANPVFRTELLGRNISKVPLSDFFSSSVHVELLNNNYDNFFVPNVNVHPVKEEKIKLVGSDNDDDDKKTMVFKKERFGFEGFILDHFFVFLGVIGLLFFFSTFL